MLKDKFKIRNIDIDLVMDKLDFQRQNPNMIAQRLDSLIIDESEDWMISRSSSSYGGEFEINLHKIQAEAH